MKIKICTPFYHKISELTQRSVAEAKKHFDITWVMGEGPYIAESRNCLMIGKQQSEKHPKLEPEYTHYLQLDSDIGFKQERLKTLLDYDVDIVSGAYLSRKGTGIYVGGEWNRCIGDMGNHISVSQKGIIAVKWVGAGFLLIKREVLEKIPAPWFCHQQIDFTEENGTEHCIQGSEDISFCIKAARFGYEIFLDASCVVEHILDKDAAYGNQKQDRGPIDVLQVKVEKDLRRIADDFSMLCEVVRSGGRIAYSE